MRVSFIANTSTVVANRGSSSECRLSTRKEGALFWWSIQTAFYYRHYIINV